MKGFWNKVKLTYRKHMPSNLSAQDISCCYRNIAMNGFADFNRDLSSVMENVTEVFEMHMT